MDRGVEIGVPGGQRTNGVRRFYSVLIVLCSTAMAMCAVAVGFARARPMPDLADGLGLCDGVPCLMGIMPGRTSLRDAVALLGNHLALGNDRTTATGSSGTYDRATVREGTPNVVGIVQIEFQQPPMITLGELVALYGPPCKVSWANDEPYILITYPYLSALIKTDVSANLALIDQRSPISRVILYSPSPESCRGQVPQVDAHPERPPQALAGPWLGFASLKRYRNR